MKIFEAFDRDPRKSLLANEGQARISGGDDSRSAAELRAELETFVCDGRYSDAIERVLHGYLTQLDSPRQHAAWISGFFGSGKSHLLKVLGHLWVNTKFDDGAFARSLVPHLPGEIDALLRELDTYSARVGLPAVALAGTLPSGSGDRVRLTVLSIILRACGYPENLAQANFCFWLREQGYYEKVGEAVAKAGKEWAGELNNLYASGLIARAVLGCDPNFANDERQARQVIREQFPNPSTDISTTEFISTIRRVLTIGSDSKELPPAILILDEAQQYIGDSTDRSTIFTELAEAIKTKLDSRVILVASGQSALSGTPTLQKLRDRFNIAVQLSDTDVEAVTRKVLLQKRPSAEQEVRDTLQKNAGEISKHLQGTRLAERLEDKKTIVVDYPLLPIRRRFWEECLRAVDVPGTHSQLRSQLKIIDDALKGIAECDLGVVIPGDGLFEAIAPDLINSGLLLNEIDVRIRQLDNGTPDGVLKKRICGLIFLVNKLPQGAVDAGVRSTPKMLADLLVKDLRIDSGPFRQKVERLLNFMAEDGTLMKVEEEYRLQTTEGAEWDRAFREKTAALRQREADITAKRDQLFATQMQKTISDIRLAHGQAKLRRNLVLHYRQEEPEVNDSIVIWLRDGWATTQKNVEAEARQRGQDDSVIHVFIPRTSAEELRTAIVEVEAAKQVLELKGAPESDSGKEARNGMLSRQQSITSVRDEIVSRVVSGAKVYQSGGNEVYEDILAKTIEVAALASLDRLFGRYHEGDHRAWDVALRRGREGSDQPLQVVDWNKPTEEHPVAREVLATIGNGARGSEIRKILKSSPYGWPQDAIDAILVALHRSGALRVTYNGQPLPPKQLDQNKTQSAEFRPETVRLSTSDKIAVRGLFHKAGVNVKSGEEELRANEFLDQLLFLARSAGGDPPLPAPPSTAQITELKRLTGTEQLGDILEKKEKLEEWIESWTRLKELSENRLPNWDMIKALFVLATGLPVAQDIEKEINAIQSNRSLLGETDQVSPLIVTAAAALREEVTRLFNSLVENWKQGMRALEANEAWTVLNKDVRGEILGQVGLYEPVQPVMGTNSNLLDELRRLPLQARADAIAAIPERITRALEEAIRRLKPKVRRLSMGQVTLETPEEVMAWLNEQQKKLLDAIKQGPIIIG